MKKNHRELKVWQKSVEFVDYGYNLINKFPKEEIYGLSSQLRRALVSVPSNIAEGSARKSDIEFIRYLNIANASLSEVDTQLYIAEMRKYITKEQAKEAYAKLNEIGKMINGLISYLKTGAKK
jgi:four helix bundle protein